MHYIKWALWNIPIAFVFIDATLKVTPFHNYMAGVAPILALILLIIACVLTVLLFIAGTIPEQWKGEDFYKIHHSLSKKVANKTFDVCFDLALVFLLSAFHFYWTAIIYLFHIFAGVMARSVRKWAKKQFDKEASEADDNN